MMQSCKLHLRRLGVTVGLIAAMSLAGCGGDDNSSSTSTVSGTAATGAPITGATVTFIGKNGKTASATTGATDGKFSADVKELTFPAIIKVDGGTAGTLYSVAEAGNTTVNITPLTTLALVLVNGLSDDLGANYADWANQATNLTSANLTEAIKKVNANFGTLDTGSGVNWNTYNFLTTAFNADHTGVDKTLDSFRFLFDFTKSLFAQIVIVQNAAGTTNFAFDDAIATSDINLGGGTTPPPAGGGTNSGSITVPSPLPTQLPITQSIAQGFSGSMTFATGQKTVFPNDGNNSSPITHAAVTDCVVTANNGVWTVSGGGDTYSATFGGPTDFVLFDQGFGATFITVSLPTSGAEAVRVEFTVRNGVIESVRGEKPKFSGEGPQPELNCPGPT